MPIRRFLIAPSLSRLIRREQGSRRLLEGHFPPSRDRCSHVVVDGKCELVLISRASNGELEEERTEVPLRQAHFLLEVCAGKIINDRTRLELDGLEVAVDSFSHPCQLALAEVHFDDDSAAEEFEVPNWLGPEVTDETGYNRHSIATGDVLAVPEVPISEESLNALLDLLDRIGRRRSGSIVQPLWPAAQLDEHGNAVGDGPTEAVHSLESGQFA
jgi:CYTH domain-containing protein